MHFAMVSGPEKMFFRHKQVHGNFYSIFEICALCALYACATYTYKSARAAPLSSSTHRADGFVTLTSKHRRRTINFPHNFA